MEYITVYWACITIMKAGGVLGNMLSYLQFSTRGMKSARKLCHLWPPLMWLSSQQGFKSLSIFKQGLEDKRKQAALLFHRCYSWAETTWWNWNGISKTIDLVEESNTDERLGFVRVWWDVGGSSSWGLWTTSKGINIFDCIMKEYAEGAASLTSTTSISVFLLHINVVTTDGTQDNKKLAHFSICPPTNVWFLIRWPPHLSPK